MLFIERRHTEKSDEYFKVNSFNPKENERWKK